MVPTAAASLDMPVELVVEAFAVVVIGGLGSMRGALVGRADRRPDARGVARLLPRARDAGDLPHRHRRAARCGRRVCSESRSNDARRRSLLLLVAAVAALALVPTLAPPYYVTLLLPSFAYAIALLGFNLLFGYTGLLSFGHALFVAVGAYGAAVIAGVLGIRSFEIVLLGGGAGGAGGRAAGGCSVVRYVRHLLRHADARLRHAVPLVPVQVLRSDRRRHRHARAARMRSSASNSALNKTELLVGPFYYYCLALLVLAGFSCGASCTRRSVCTCAAIRENPRKAEYLGVRVRLFRLVAFLISAFYGAVGGVILAFRTGQADPELAYWTHSGELVFMTVLGGFASFFGPIVGALALHLPAGPADVHHAVLALRAGRRSSR